MIKRRTVAGGVAAFLELANQGYDIAEEDRYLLVNKDVYKLQYTALVKDDDWILFLFIPALEDHTVFPELKEDSFYLKTSFFMTEINLEND